VIAAAALDFSDVAERLRRITVEITTDGTGIGCGVLWPRGCVVTNAHVIRRERAAVRLFDGARLAARVLARDDGADLALLGILDADGPVARLAQTPARVGSLVVAVGHPLGGAVTAGIVHAVGPVVPRGRTWIQADLQLAPGNSGGPLADVAGDVVGLNAMIAGGLALAVPVARVAAFVRAAGVATT